MKHCECNRHQGYTLIELMVTVAIVGVLAAVAIPNYTQYIVRSNRADAQERLTSVMFEMERFATRNRTYTTDLTALGFDSENTSQELYTINAQECGTESIASCVLLTAVPVPGKTQEQDGNLTLNSRGARSDNWNRR